MSDSRVRAIVRAAQSGDVDAWGVIEQALARIAPELPSKVYLLGYTGPDSATFSDFLIFCLQIEKRQKQKLERYYGKSGWTQLEHYLDVLIG